MARRLGGQRPTFERVGKYAYSRGSEAVAMFEEYGRRYYDSQKYEMEIFFARDDHGDFAAMTIGITKPRQNGKSFGARDYATWMSSVESKNVLYSAHHGRTVRKMFKEICDFIESHEDFRDELDYIYKAGGYEGIYFRDGSCIEFQTRTNSGGRGGTYSVIIVDEAQELTPAQQDALLPVASAAGELDEGNSLPQIIYLGTVPGPECQGTVWRELHDKAHEGGDTSIWWLEWGAQGDSLDEVDVDSVDLWYATNPAMGRRMDERTVRNEHDTMTRDGFARERLGWWSPVAGKPQSALDVGAWKELATDHPSESPDKTAYGVRFSVDGQWAALAVAEQTGDVTHVELLEMRPMREGLTWLVEWLAKHSDVGCSVGIDGKAGTQALVERMDGAPKGYMLPLPAAQAGMPAAMLADAIADKSISWYRPQSQLLDSVETSTRRRIGRDGAWGFEGENATPIEACGNALWALRTTSRNPAVTGGVYF